MKNVFLLLRVQTSAMLGMNAILHLRDRKERRRKLAGKVGLWLCWAAVFLVVGAYAYIMGAGMDALGQMRLFPGVMLACTCVVTLLTSISLANGTLFAFKDYEFVASLPVRSWEIGLSRLMLGYLCNALLDLPVMICCGAAYALIAKPGGLFYPTFLLTMLAAPVIPMAVGSLIGVALARVTSGFRGGKYLQMLAATACSLAMMFVGFRMDSFMEGGVFGDVGVKLASVMNRIYPLTGMYLSAVSDLNGRATAQFVLLAAAVLAGMALLMGRFMKPINEALTATRAGANYRMKRLRVSSPLTALYRKELRRYLSSAPWLFNTAFGLLLALIGVGILMVKGRSILTLVLASLEIAGVDDRLVAYAVAYIGAGIIAMSSTTSCSISMEGRNLWLIRSLPVTGFQVLMSKLLVDLTLTIPTSVVIGVGAGVALRFDAGVMADMTAVCAGYAVLSASVGLVVNLKSHDFAWTTEAVVVKQSASVGVSLLINMTLVIAPAALLLMHVEHAGLIFRASEAAAALLSAALIAWFRVSGDTLLQKL